MRPFPSLRGALPVAAASLLATAALPAQGPIFKVYGDSNYDGLGRAVSWLGDLNGDGRDEFLAGAPLDDNNGRQDSGMVRLFNGATGLTWYSIDGDSLADEFGGAVQCVGDVNGDGTPDFAVGARLDDNLANGGGMCRLYSGSGFYTIYQWDGPGADDALGCAIAYAGDLNGDGYNEVIVGARQRQDGASTNAGYVNVYSGINGTVMYQLVGGTTANDQFGYAVGGGYDVNGDGVNDIAVGAYGDDTSALNAGAIRVFSGANGALLYSVYGDTAQDHLGNAVALIGDVNGDGRADLLGCALGDDTNASGAGMARVYRGDTGATLSTLRGTQANGEFGYSCCAVADLNGDTVEEFIVCAWRDDSFAGVDVGIAYVFDGATLTLYQYSEGADSDRLGFGCSRAGDVNNDGVEDYMVGASQYGSPNGNGQGYAAVMDSTVAPPPPPVRWPNRPSTYAAVGSAYSDNFEAYAGVVPAHMAVNELGSQTRTYDPDAWCNIGQNGATTGGSTFTTPHSGTYMLEMGGTPNGMSSSHDISNGLVLGLNGSGSNNLELDFWAMNFGEESNLDDGVWVSNDGLTWENVLTNWSGVQPLATWVQQTGISLSSGSTSTAGNFFLLFAQMDNNALGGGNDGVAIDDLRVAPLGSNNPILTIYNLIAGQITTIEVSNCSPGNSTQVGYSLAGGGPVNTPLGLVYLSPPFNRLPVRVANAQGIASLSAPVPGNLSGRNIWFHGANLTAGLLTNPIATQVQ